MHYPVSVVSLWLYHDSFFLCSVAEIPEEPKGATGFAAIVVIVVMFVGLVIALLILHMRKKGLSLHFLKIFSSFLFNLN